MLHKVCSDFESQIFHGCSICFAVEQKVTRNCNSFLLVSFATLQFHPSHKMICLRATSEQEIFRDHGVIQGRAKFILKLQSYECLGFTRRA